MFELKQTDLTLTQGDQLALALHFTGRVIPANASALFTVKARPGDKDPVLQKTLPIQNNVAQLILRPEDTRALRPRPYVWDVRVLYADGAVTTPMAYAAFDIQEVIGDV